MLSPWGKGSFTLVQSRDRLLVVGSVALDTIETPAGKREDVPGGSALHCSLAASLYVPVHLVGVIGEDFPQEPLRLLERRGVNLKGLQRVPGKTFRWSGRYHQDWIGRDTLDTQLNVFADFKPAIPDKSRDCEVLFLANIQPQLQLDVLDAMKRPRLVALDTMNYWIKGDLPLLKKVLRRTHLLIINDEEARQLSGMYSLLKAARGIMAMGPKVVILKKGEHGSIVFAKDYMQLVPAYLLEDIEDPTGAGDTFAGGVMAVLTAHRGLSDAILRKAVIHGTIMASFGVEGFGPERLNSLTIEEVEARKRQYLTQSCPTGILPVADYGIEAHRTIVSPPNDGNAGDRGMLEASRWHDDHMEIVDQSQLPGNVAIVRMETLEDVVDAIRTLKIRGAPAIGIAAGYGVVVGVRNLIRDGQLGGDAIEEVLHRLGASRPTAVNLFWALERMRKVVSKVGFRDGSALIAALLQEAVAIHQEDKELCRKISDHGAGILPEGGILTHCHAGALATGGIGTAVGVIRTAHQMGKPIHVYADETRPLLQGARLTAWELQQSGIPITLICDNMAASLMASGKIQSVIVGADRIASNGDTANKIGTYSVAVLAKYHSLPFFVAAPYSTIDPTLKSGAEIPIEQRDPDEVRGFRDQRWAPENVPVWNAAFDVTPASLITAIITETGVSRFPYHFGS